MIVILMGVSGSGKTTIGKLLAERTGAIFADADDHHPDANKLKMAAGIALTDADRQPWLEELNRLLLNWFVSGQGGILACSALKESYRKTLTAGIPVSAVRFVHLDGSRELIAARIATRGHEFMNPKLLDSQIATLEPPTDAFGIVNDLDPEMIVSAIRAHVSL